MKYLLTESQKKFMQGILNENQCKVEDTKREKYNPYDLFKK